MEIRIKIVIVDDSVFVRKWTRVALGTTRYELIEIDSPIGIVQAIARHQPSLVLMDVNMPAIEGNRLTEIIRRSGTQRCPLVLYSTKPEAQLAALARACGADGYIEKTHDAAAFRRAVQRYVSAPPDAPAGPLSVASDHG
jgi:CheY-like chemotaxis protein